jgi:4-hydroxy-tetrahydrodipicolinate synthase
VDTDEVKSSMRGPLAPVLTVYREQDLSLDLDAIQANVDQQIHRGMKTGSGVLLAAGAGGDFPLLSKEERKEVIRAVAQAASDRVPVLGCCQSPLTQEAIELAEWSQQAGCYGIQLSPTWYYLPNERQIFEHFKAVAESIDICVMIYHTPWLGSHISMDLFNRMWDECANIRAIKWAGSGSSEAISGYIELAGKYAMINNGVDILQGAVLGANGFVTHLANVWPEHEVGFWRLVEDEDYKGAAEEFRKVNWPWLSLRNWVHLEVGRGESMAVKPPAELTGFRGGPSRPPMVNLDQRQRAHVRSVLSHMGAPLV